jgi:hypothetical protein
MGVDRKARAREGRGAATVGFVTGEADVVGRAVAAVQGLKEPAEVKGGE